MAAHIDVAAAIIRKKDAIFVARRAPNQKMAGLWEFPGGKIETGETPQCCVVRELTEELSMTTAAGAIIATNTHRYEELSVNLIAVEVQMLKDQFTLTVHDRADWVPLNRLLELDLAPADIPIAEKVIAVSEQTGA